MPAGLPARHNSQRSSPAHAGSPRFLTQPVRTSRSADLGSSAGRAGTVGSISFRIRRTPAGCKRCRQRSSAGRNCCCGGKPDLDGCLHSKPVRIASLRFRRDWWYENRHAYYRSSLPRSNSLGWKNSCWSLGWSTSCWKWRTSRRNSTNCSARPDPTQDSSSSRKMPAGRIGPLPTARMLPLRASISARRRTQSLFWRQPNGLAEVVHIASRIVFR